jgi:DNA-binding transcriptional LysR family regulator
LRITTPKVPEDLGHHDFITTGDLNSVSLEGPQGTIEIPLRVALRCRTVADVAVTVAGGMGLALLPAALFNDSAFVNVLRPVLTAFQLKQSTLYLLYPGRKYLPCKVRAFIDLALESGATNPKQTHTPAAANRTRLLPEERVQALAG